jgi:hypothetical protein
MIDKQSQVPKSAPGTDEACRNLSPIEIDAVAGGTKPAPTVHPATTYLTIILNNTLISG